MHSTEANDRDRAVSGQQESRLGLIRALVVEDHPLMAAAIDHALSSQEGIEVVGTCRTAEEAVASINSLRPDVVVLDLRLGRQSQPADQTAKRLLEAVPSTRVVVYSAYVTRALMWRLGRISIFGYVSKGEPPETLVEAVVIASQGHTFYSSEARALAQVEQTERDEGTATITPRETEVIQLIAEGHTNPEIGRRLSISVSAVIKLAGQASRNLGATNRQTLALRAVRAGLVIIDEQGLRF